MATPESLSTEQHRRKETVISTLAVAGWRDNNGLWGHENIDTDFVASMTHKNGSGIGLQCDYVVTDAEPLSEGLNLTVIVGRAAAEVYIDVLDQFHARDGDDHLAEALAILVAEQEGLSHEALDTFIRKLLPICPVLITDDGGELRPVSHFLDLDELGLLGNIAQTARRTHEALQVRATDPNLWTELGLLFLALDKKDEAATSFSSAVELDPTLKRAVLELGPLDAADPETKIERLKALAAAQPEDVRCWCDLGLSLVKAGRHAESIEATTVAVRLRPGHANAFYTRACAHALSGDPDAAFADIARALELDPGLRDEIRTDEDFASIAQTDTFHALTVEST